MGQKRKDRKKKIKITPAIIAGMIFGLLVVGTGLHILITTGKYVGYPTIGLGICLMILIVIVSRGRTR